MNFLLFVLALVGWSVAIVAVIAFSVVSMALVSIQSEQYDKLGEEFEKFLRDDNGRQ